MVCAAFLTSTIDPGQSTQIVHGELLGRVELVVMRNSEAIAGNTEAIARLTDGMQIMQAAMHRLFEHMDRFIRGLEGDGHRGRSA